MIVFVGLVPRVLSWPRGLDCLHAVSAEYNRFRSAAPPIECRGLRSPHEIYVGMLRSRPSILHRPHTLCLARMLYVPTGTPHCIPTAGMFVPARLYSAAPGFVSSVIVKQ